MRHFLSSIKVTFSLFAIAFFGMGLFAVYAAQPTSFDIELDPSSLVTGEPADMTVNAVDEDGSLVKDFEGPILISFEGFQDIDAYDVPDGGYYEFLPEDQGSKRFSKGLVMKKSGDYVLRVEIPGEDVVGTTSVRVDSNQETQETTNKQNIQLQEPLPNSEVRGSSLNVVGLSDSRQTPLEFEIDGETSQHTGQTDDSGVFSSYIGGLSEGEHTLVVKLLNFQGDVIGESEEVPFVYFPPATDDFLKSFTSSNSGSIEHAEVVTFHAEADASVKSITLDVVSLVGKESKKSFVMDQNEAGLFEKSIKFSEKGVFKLDITLIFEGGQDKEYLDRVIMQVPSGDSPGTGSIVEAVGIKRLKVVNDAADPSLVEISWTTFGNPSSFLVRYGASEDDLSEEAKVKEKQINVSGLAIGKKYYFQIFPLNEEGEIDGQESDIATIMTKGKSEDDGAAGPSCVVVGIEIATKKIGDDYYLTRDRVENAKSYTIYSSDVETSRVSDMTKIATVNTPEFKYPFDVDAEEDEYTYYAVVAQCNDGNELQLDSVKKIHTGPASDLLLFVVLASLGYMIFRIYRYNY